MDVSTANAITISDRQIHRVPLDAWGPTGNGLSALSIGCSSSTLQGLMVHVGVIDGDYTGQICAMVSTATPPVTIPQGTRLAQLVPFVSCVPRTEQVVRGDSAFGSTGKPSVLVPDGHRQEAADDLLACHGPCSPLSDKSFGITGYRG